MEGNCYNTVQQAFHSDQAVLCYCCIGKASKFNKLQNQLCQLKEEMASVLRDNPEDNPVITDSSTQPESFSETHTPQRVKRPRAPAVPAKRVKTSVRPPFMLDEINQITVASVYVHMCSY